QQIDRMQTLIELKSVAPATAAPHQDATACDTKMPQHATLQSVAVPQHKKRGLFGRVLNAVFDND
ncbi:DNA-binding protein, partial [Acinetobacter baumannii]